MSLESDAEFSFALEQEVLTKTREAITKTMAEARAKNIEYAMVDLTKALVLDWFHKELKPVVLDELNAHKAEIAKVVVDKTVTTILQTVAGAVTEKLSDPNFVRTLLSRW